MKEAEHFKNWLLNTFELESISQESTNELKKIVEAADLK